MNKTKPFNLLNILFFSGIIFGFIIGYSKCTGISTALTGAQILAGTVDYPQDSLWEYFNLKSWCITVQTLGLLLSMNLDEIFLSKLLCGLEGVLLFSWCSIFIYSFTKNIFLSFLLPFMLFFVDIAAFVNAGLPYPSRFFSWSSKGSIGFHFAALIISCMFARYHKGVRLFFGDAVFVYMPTGVYG